MTTRPRPSCTLLWVVVALATLHLEETSVQASLKYPLNRRLKNEEIRVWGGLIQSEDPRGLGKIKGGRGPGETPEWNSNISGRRSYWDNMPAWEDFNNIKESNGVKDELKGIRGTGIQGSGADGERPLWNQNGSGISGGTGWESRNKEDLKEPVRSEGGRGDGESAVLTAIRQVEGTLDSNGNKKTENETDIGITNPKEVDKKSSQVRGGVNTIESLIRQSGFQTPIRGRYIYGPKTSGLSERRDNEGSVEKAETLPYTRGRSLNNEQTRVDEGWVQSEDPRGFGKTRGSGVDGRFSPSHNVGKQTILVQKSQSVQQGKPESQTIRWIGKKRRRRSADGLEGGNISNLFMVN